jgi:hypothetical protein
MYLNCSTCSSVGLNLILLSHVSEGLLAADLQQRKSLLLKCSYDRISLTVVLLTIVIMVIRFFISLIIIIQCVEL